MKIRRFQFHTIATTNITTLRFSQTPSSWHLKNFESFKNVYCGLQDSLKLLSASAEWVKCIKILIYTRRAYGEDFISFLPIVYKQSEVPKE